MRKQCIPSLLLVVLILILVGVAVFVSQLKPPAERLAELNASIEDLESKGVQMQFDLKTQEERVRVTKQKLERTQQFSEKLDQDKEYYQSALENWGTQQTKIEPIMSTWGEKENWGYAVAPNYDRENLTYLQRGSTVASEVGKVSGLLGSVVGNSMVNNTQSDVKAACTLVSELSDEMNATLQQAEQATTALYAKGALAQSFYNQSLTGEALLTQIQFLNLMYTDQEIEELKTTMLKNLAKAKITMDCYIPLYYYYLVDNDSNNAYLSSMEKIRDSLQSMLADEECDAYEYLDQKTLDETYIRTVQWYRRIAELIQGSEVWSNTTTRFARFSTKQTITVTWRTNTMMAFDEKEGQNAFYGFDRNGNPQCFALGGKYILFDSGKGGGATQFSSYSDTDTNNLYQVALKLSTERIRIPKNVYESYQRIY